ncbi:hypothetical protein MAPG_05340 [Magnaporthiopsis poae ATCC 64411]|uniref:Uncharacterized protein n=1 Tax=Magnaporthiopsis poae (strain ATCC 64411 / 73-15) TaxID=644358 RepID=A0A0C4DZ51_MAGP6|nr:hypothetical protein MAPG_05340 [Magnaporthiopsis poae ATCC 64411]
MTPNAVPVLRWQYVNVLLLLAGSYLGLFVEAPRSGGQPAANLDRGIYRQRLLVLGTHTVATRGHPVFGIFDFPFAAPHLLNLRLLGAGKPPSQAERSDRGGGSSPSGEKWLKLFAVLGLPRVYSPVFLIGTWSR